MYEEDLTGMSAFDLLKLIKMEDEQLYKTVNDIVESVLEAGLHSDEYKSKTKPSNAMQNIKDRNKANGEGRY